ncbi:glycosyltransferase family 4 protein [Patescibacteria group bacterium]|nr:glycosyltransferase family 4 protein [Patescibacteria group bacterium]
MLFRKASSPKNIRVAYILGEFPSISETFITNEILELRRQGVSIQIFALQKKVEAASQKQALALLPEVIFAPSYIIKSNRDRVQLLIKAPLWNLLTILRARHLYYNHYFLSLWLAGQVRAHHINRLHAHFPEPSLVAMITSLLTGVPYSFTVHSHLENEKKYWIKERVARAASVIAIGEAVRKDLAGICKNNHQHKMHVVRSGLSNSNARTHIHRPPPKRGARHGGFKIITVARLVKHKGITYLIEAFRQFHSAHPDTSLEIIGDGPERKNIVRQIRRHRLSASIHLNGALPHGTLFDRKLRGSDTFILPCITDENHNQDGLPVSILEAMAAGLPVVSTSIASIPEAVHSDNGILIEEKQSDAIIYALETLYTMPSAQRLAMGGKSQKYLRKYFSLPANVQRLKRILIT